ncbi:MAG: oligosaccharide flippase family protein [Candidatus Borkfalkiaceae bacterium]|nr:oligosaccharide flippase family protein [Christensenellaceae bacterium]
MNTTIGKTVFTVTAFSFAERFLGFVYRIFLSRTLGAEGLGIYQISLSVLGLFMTMTSSGIPITVSRILTKHKAEGNTSADGAAVSSGILLTLAVSVPVTVAVLLRSPAVGFLFSDDRCMTALTVMIPGLVITSVYAVFRGVMWGKKQFLTYSVVELAEEAVMLLAGILLVTGLNGKTDGVRKACLAVLISYVFSFCVSTALYFIRKGRLSSPGKELKPLLTSSVPITLMRTSTSLVNTLIAVLLPARLIRYGMESAAAVGEFGKIFGMALPLIFIPSSLIGSIALVLVPELSENFYTGKFKTLRNNVEKAAKFSCFVACAVIPIFFVFGKELGAAIYSDASAGEYVSVSAIVMLPLSLSLITTSMLNSLNKEKQTLLIYSLGASALILSVLFLPKYLGAKSLSFGMFFNFTVSATGNLVLLYRVCPEKPRLFGFIAKSFFFTLPCMLFGIFLRNLLTAKMSALPVFLVGATVLGVTELILYSVFGLTGLEDNVSVFPLAKNGRKIPIFRKRLTRTKTSA